MYLYHYFDRCTGPFLSVTARPQAEAKAILSAIKEKNPKLVNPNLDWFLDTRYKMEKRLRDSFLTIGGKPVRSSPVYMTLGEHPQLATWFEHPEMIRIPIEEFDLSTVSFTYGDLFAVFNPALNDGREFWNTVYQYDGIQAVVEKYGFPPLVDYNVREGKYPDYAPINHLLKYVEAHVWSDEALDRYRKRA